MQPSDAKRKACAACLAAMLALGGCVGGPGEGPGEFLRQLGTDGLDGRQPPPGFEGRFPNLASVPAPPTPPSAEARATISERLARDRAAATGPAPVPSAPRGLPASAAPPARPVLAPVPPAAATGAAPVPLAPPPPGVAPAPAAAAPTAPPAAAAPPAPRLQEDAAPPPPPSPDLLAPRRP
jgi:hypothetical protein